MCSSDLFELVCPSETDDDSIGLCSNKLEVRAGLSGTQTELENGGSIKGTESADAKEQAVGVIVLLASVDFSYSDKEKSGIGGLEAVSTMREGAKTWSGAWL